MVGWHPPYQLLFRDKGDADLAAVTGVAFVAFSGFGGFELAIGGVGVAGAILAVVDVVLVAVGVQVEELPRPKAAVAVVGRVSDDDRVWIGIVNEAGTIGQFGPVDRDGAIGIGFDIVLGECGAGAKAQGQGGEGFGEGFHKGLLLAGYGMAGVGSEARMSVNAANLTLPRSRDKNGLPVRETRCRLAIAEP